MSGTWRRGRRRARQKQRAQKVTARGMLPSRLEAEQRHARLLFLMQRDGGVCRLCGITVLLGREHGALSATCDHIVPRSRGGLDVAENWQLACRGCNEGKGCTLPPDADVKTVRAPSRERVAKKAERGLVATVEVMTSRAEVRVTLDDGTTEVAFNGGEFTDRYRRSRVADYGHKRSFVLIREGGWPQAETVEETDHEEDTREAG